MMEIFTRDGLRELLKNNIVQITFTKLNGDDRDLVCTLKNDVLPAQPSASRKLLQENGGPDDHILAVWDLKKNSWRSFRVESVKSVSIGPSTQWRGLSNSAEFLI